MRDFKKPLRRSPAETGRPYAIGAVLTLAFCAAAYAFFVEPDWVAVTEHRVAADADVPIRVVQLSDLHLREIGARERRVLELVGGLDPDAVVLSGDVVDRPESLEALGGFLSGLPAAPKFAVLGNWEYWGGVPRDRLEAVYAEHGVRLLVNARADLRLGTKRLAVVGLDDFTAGKPEEAGLLSGAPEGGALVLVEHSPGYFDGGNAPGDAPSWPDLCLSGHTHGGQIAFFGFPLWTPPGSGKFAAGWYGGNGCPLYVSRGIGTSVLPVRFWNRPEVAVFELRRMAGIGATQ